MKKEKIYIPNNPNNTTSTYFKKNTTKIKRIPDNGTPYDHIFVGKNEFIEFLQSAKGTSDTMQIIEITGKDTYESTNISQLIPNPSGISAIIQD